METTINNQSNPPTGYSMEGSASANQPGKGFSIIIKIFFFLIAIIALGAIIFVAYGVLTSPSVSVSDQTFKRSVEVKKLVLKKRGFLVLEAANRYGKPAGTIGNTEILPPDTYTDFSVDLYKETLESQIADSATDTNPQLLKPGNFIYVTVYEDSDGDNGFTLGRDKSAKDWLGGPVTKRIKLK